MPTERMGPPPGALPPMRMTASWLGPEVDLPNTSLPRQKMRQWRAPLGPSTDSTRQTPKAMQKAPVAVHHRSACSGVKACPWLEQGALRNTSVARRQADKLRYRFGPLTPSARSGSRIAGDGTWRNRRASTGRQPQSESNVGFGGPSRPCLRWRHARQRSPEPGPTWGAWSTKLETDGILVR